MTKNFIVNGHELDNSQMEIINTSENSLVIAGAGSGKSFSMIAKVQYLLEKGICIPSEILVISFTNSTVSDLHQKINSKIDIYTFHKLSMHILKIVNINYNILPSNTLRFIINEYLQTCSIDEQKAILKFLNTTISYCIFLNSKQYDSFCNFIETYINTIKANNINSELIKNSNYTLKEKRILIIIFNIYLLYQQEKQSINAFDFDDLIINATKYVPKANLKYKYIIVDEFQDTSYIRLNLINEIYKYTNSKIIVVGDDWQSIYHFSGCNLNIFMNFKNIFKNTKTIFLKNTYRNSLELIQIASDFIERNPYQIKKVLFSSKHNYQPIIFFPYLDAKKALKKILDYLIKTTSSIMILSRNNIDIFDYIDHNYSFNDNKLLYKNVKISYYTIHKAKGLEADYVLILNCNNTTLGLPNQIENNVMIKKINQTNEINFAEERRLFYVALTRGKEQVYILYDKYNPSVFVKEIKKITKKRLKKITYFK